MYTSSYNGSLIPVDSLRVQCRLVRGVELQTSCCQVDVSNEAHRHDETKAPCPDYSATNNTSIHHERRNAEDRQYSTEQFLSSRQSSQCLE